MGYVIEIVQGPRERICSFCGDEAPLPSGLALVQRPSGDGVCEECAKEELRGLYLELCVLRDDSPTDLPDRWPALESRLAREPGPDGELSRLLRRVALQRNRAYQPLEGSGNERR